MKRFVRHDRFQVQIVLFIAAIVPLVLAACNNGGGGPAY
jgi:hypothetical protein